MPDEIPMFDLRHQDTKNRQNSTDDVPYNKKKDLEYKIAEHFVEAMDLYNELLGNGIAKECARFVLPLATPTRLYMTGTVRSWIHYIQLRGGHGTQKEHMDIAHAIEDIFIKEFPITSEALEF